MATEKGSKPSQRKDPSAKPAAKVAANHKTPAPKAKLTPEQAKAAALGGPVQERKAPIKAKKVATKKPAKASKPVGDSPATQSPKPTLGRPTTYTQDLADHICALLAEGKSMRTVCHDDGMPAMSSVFKWLREHKDFSEQYTRAKAESADAMTEEMNDIADDGTNDWMEKFDKDGNNIGWQLNGEHVQRSKLRIETRKWLASKLKPKKYGEKVDLNHGVQPDSPIMSLLQQVSGTALPVVKDGSEE